MPADKGAAAAAADGVRSFVVGTGGKRLYSDDYTHKWAFSETIGLQSYGVLRLRRSIRLIRLGVHSDQGQQGLDHSGKAGKSDQCNVAP